MGKQQQNDSAVHKLFRFVLKFNKWLVIGATIALFAVGYLTYDKLQVEMHKMVRNQLESSLTGNAEALHQWLESQKNHINALAKHPEIKDLINDLTRKYHKEGTERILQSDDLETLRNRLRSYCQETDFQEFFIINYDYQCVAAENIKLIGYQMSDKNPSLAGIRNLASTIIQLPIKSAEDTGAGAISMFVATPIYNAQGNPVAIFALTLPPEKTFSRVMAASRVGESGETYAINDDAWMISGSRFTEQLREEGHLAKDQKSSVLQIRANNLEGDLTKMAASALSKSKEVVFPYVESNIDGYADYR